VWRLRLDRGSGTVSAVQLVPFHSSLKPVPVQYGHEPTAMQALAEVHDTALRVPVAPAMAPLWTDHFVPFHTSISCVAFEP
jgi:hypothetical protein